MSHSTLLLDGNMRLAVSGNTQLAVSSNTQLVVTVSCPLTATSYADSVKQPGDGEQDEADLTDDEELDGQPNPEQPFKIPLIMP